MSTIIYWKISLLPLSHIVSGWAFGFVHVLSTECVGFGESRSQVSHPLLCRAACLCSSFSDHFPSHRRPCVDSTAASSLCHELTSSFFSFVWSNARFFYLYNLASSRRYFVCSVAARTATQINRFKFSGPIFRLYFLYFFRLWGFSFETLEKWEQQRTVNLTTWHTPTNVHQICAIFESTFLSFLEKFLLLPSIVIQVKRHFTLAKADTASENWAEAHRKKILWNSKAKNTKHKISQLILVKWWKRKRRPVGDPKSLSPKLSRAWRFIQIVYQAIIKRKWNCEVNGKLKHRA